jgi:hypothetical protein
MIDFANQYTTNAMVSVWNHTWDKYANQYTTDAVVSVWNHTWNEYTNQYTTDAVFGLSSGRSLFLNWSLEHILQKYQTWI